MRGAFANQWAANRKAEVVGDGHRKAQPKDKTGDKVYVRNGNVVLAGKLNLVATGKRAGNGGEALDCETY